MFLHLISALAGVWLMVAPHVLDLAAFCANHERIIGPLIAMFAIVAMSQATRSVRFVALALGCWVVIAPFALGYWSSEPLARNNDILTGLICAIASSFRGRVTEKFGGGWSVLWKGQG